MKKRDIITIAILVAIFGVLFIILLFNKDNSEEEKIKNTEFKTLSTVTTESIFFSVEKNINRLYEYANTDTNAFNAIIKNNVNISDYQSKSFEAEEVLVVSELNLYKYYIKGNLYEEFMDEVPRLLRQEYYILNYDMESTSYNIEIINNIQYENAKEEKYIFEIIDSNKYNRFEYSNLTPKTRAIMYFNNYLNKIYSNTEEAYNLLSIETKNTYFNNYEDFENFVKNINNISLVEYSVNDNRIGIKDNYSNEYLFDITNILSYNVTINIAED